MDDGLLAFIEQLRGAANIQSETVNLCPLFSAFGAQENAKQPTADSVKAQMQNARKVIRIAERTGWYAEMPENAFRCGILLLQLPKQQRQIPASQLQQVFSDQSTFLTAYDRGMVRLSLPTEPLSAEDLERLECALVSSYLAASEDYAPIPG